MNTVMRTVRKRGLRATRSLPALAQRVTRFVLLPALAAAGAAQAQDAAVPTGFSWGPGVTVEHDSNFLRSSGLQPGFPLVEDTLYTTDLMGSFHQVYGRHELTASATVGRVVLEHLHQYDYTQEALRAVLQSSLPDNINSMVAVSRSAQLASFGDTGNAARDVIVNNDINGTFSFPVAVDWRIVVGGEGSQTKNSATVEISQDFNSVEVNGGLRFQPVSGNHVDLLLREVHATYPNFGLSSVVNPGYRDRGADLRADWSFSGLSHLSGFAGFVRRSYDPLLASASAALLAADPLASLNRNFSGPAYSLSYLWQITAASKLTVTGDRVTGAAGDNNFLSAVTHTYRLTPGYQPTAKLELDAYLEWVQRDYFSNVLEFVEGLPAGTARLDTAHNVGANVVWNPRRWLQASFSVHREHRESNIPIFTYAGNVISLNLQGNF